MAVNSSVEKQPVDQQASGEVQAEIDTRSDGVSPMPNDVSKHNEVSKHPGASIPESTLSLADIERKRSHPALWLAYALLVIAAIVVPYWWGRAIAVNDTQWLLVLRTSGARRRVPRLRRKPAANPISTYPPNAAPSSSPSPAKSRTTIYVTC